MSLLRGHPDAPIEAEDLVQEAYAELWLRRAYLSNGARNMGATIRIIVQRAAGRALKEALNCPDQIDPHILEETVDQYDTVIA